MCQLKRGVVAGHWWLTPVILAAQVAEIRRIKVQSQPRQKVQSQPRQIVHGIYLEKNPSQKKGWWSGSRCRP
jgi:hypothetical protein